MAGGSLIPSGFMWANAAEPQRCINECQPSMKRQGVFRSLKRRWSRCIWQKKKKGAVATSLSQLINWPAGFKHIVVWMIFVQ